MKKNLPEISARIKKNRKKHNMTQKELAEPLHITPGTISKWENGDSFPSIEDLMRLSDIFNTSIDELVRNAIKQDSTPTDIYEKIETFCIPRREGVFVDLVKNHQDEQLELWICDLHYGGIKIMVDYRPALDYPTDFFKNEFLSKSDEMLHTFRDLLDESGIGDISPEERHHLEEYEAILDSIKDIHARLEIN